MNPSPSQPDGWSCHWLSYGKLVLETGAVRPGTEHALNGLSRGFPDLLRRVIDLETLFGSGIEASQVVADNRLDTGAFVYAPVFIPDEDGAADVGYAVFLRIAAPSEAGVDKAARQFTQFAALAVRLAEWCPDLVLAACLGLFDDGHAQPLREMRRDADPVWLPRPRIPPPPLAGTLAVSPAHSSAVRVDMTQVTTAVREICAWMSEAAAVAPVPAEGQILSLASLPVGLGLRVGASLLGMPIAIRDRAGVAAQDGPSPPQPAPGDDGAATGRTPYLPDLIPLSRVVTHLGRPAWTLYWGLTRDECVGDITALADLLADLSGDALGHRTILLLETCFPFGSTALGHRHPLADCSVADVLRRLLLNVMPPPDLVPDENLTRWRALLAPWFDGTKVIQVVEPRTEPLAIGQGGADFDHLSDPQVHALAALYEIVVVGLRAATPRQT